MEFDYVIIASNGIRKQGGKLACRAREGVNSKDMPKVINHFQEICGYPIPKLCYLILYVIENGENVFYPSHYHADFFMTWQEVFYRQLEEKLQCFELP